MYGHLNDNLLTEQYSTCMYSRHQFVSPMRVVSDVRYQNDS